MSTIEVGVADTTVHAQRVWVALTKLHTRSLSWILKSIPAHNGHRLGCRGEHGVWGVAACDFRLIVATHFNRAHQL